MLADGERGSAGAPRPRSRRRSSTGRALEVARRRADYRRARSSERENAYELFKKGSELLEPGDFMAASVPLEQARALEPDKSSIREALGRAYFRSARFEQAARGVRRAGERYPVNDFAHFCLGRSLEKTGRRGRGRRHAALAAHMRPDRKDYQAFGDRLQTA